MRSEDENVVLSERLNAVWRAVRNLYVVCGEFFLPIESQMITEQKKESRHNQNGTVSKNDYGWIAANPPYYSGQYNVWSSGLTILGSGLFGSSFGMLQSEQWGWMFPGMFFGGIAFVALGWALMGIHTKCETIKAAKLREDESRTDRIQRYCKRYKKAAKQFESEAMMADRYTVQAMADARPEFLRSNDELVAACNILREIRVPPVISPIWLKHDLRQFLIDARAARLKLIDDPGDWHITLWMKGVYCFVDDEYGNKHLAERPGAWDSVPSSTPEEKALQARDGAR